MKIFLKMWWQHICEYKFEIILLGSMQIINIIFLNDRFLLYGLIYILFLISFITLYLTYCLYRLNIENINDFQRKFVEGFFNHSDH